MGLTYVPFNTGYGVRAVAKFCLSCLILKIDINEYINCKHRIQYKVQFQSHSLKFIKITCSPEDPTKEDIEFAFLAGFYNDQQ